MRIKDETVDWCAVFTVFLLLMSLPIIFWEMGLDIHMASYAINSGHELTLMEKIFNVPLILMYMGFDVDKAMLSSIARYLLTIIGGFMLAIQMYFGYLLLKLRGWKAIFRALVFFSVYILTIKFYIDWGLFFSLPLR